MYIKDFDSWNEMQKHINSNDMSVNIRAGEIRWVAFGVNIGSEIDGKGKSFTRPALIIHVIGSNLALVVPLSTKLKKWLATYILNFRAKLSLCVFTNLKQFLKKEYFLVKVEFLIKSSVRLRSNLRNFLLYKQIASASFI